MLREFRDVVAHHLVGSSWPVHRYLPDDVAEVPCIAVPRPRLTPGPGTPSIPAGALIVLVVGRRMNDDDAQAELDEVADLVVARFGNLAKSVRLEDPLIPRLVVDDVSPSTVTVAGLDYPVYAVTIAASFTLC